MKYLLSVFFIVFFQGCVSTNLFTAKTVDKEKTYPQTIHVNKNFQAQPKQQYASKTQTFVYTKQSKTKAILKTSFYTGSIKGVIQKLSFDKFKKSWLYEVRGIDISNDKLPYAKFYHHKKLANEGDLVYIILNNSQLQNLFFIKKANRIKKVKLAKHIRVKKFNHKEEKRRKKPKIALPTVEHVSF
jgi:hypothetical protein